MTSFWRLTCRSAALSLTLLLSFSITFSAALAQSSLTFEGVNLGESGEIEVQAGALSVDQSTSEARFSQGVTITQGNTSLTAGEMILGYNEQTKQIATFRANGQVRFKAGDNLAQAKSATFDVNKRSLTLKNDVRIKQGPFNVTAQSAKIDLKSGRVVLEGNVVTTLP